jgi:aminopeptidase N
MIRLFLAFTLLLLYYNSLVAQSFSHADSLRGTYSNARDWWDIQHYTLKAEPNAIDKTIKGTCIINFDKVNKAFDALLGDSCLLQIDLQEPLVIESISLNEQNINGTRDANAYLYKVNKNLVKQKENLISIQYSGKPRSAKNAPWDGGFIWKVDDQGNDFISVACQHLGSSVWYPCKDHQADEPQSGAQMTIVHDNKLTMIGNGKLVNRVAQGDKTATTFEVKNAINNYNFVFYLGDYQEKTLTYNGLNGALSCTFSYLKADSNNVDHVMDDMLRTLKSFEDWFGPYPWYSDGYKLVQAPHLGMEHQSAVAYGNDFKKGYRGLDLSGTGWGKKWDYIVVHESGHEWWGNNVTTKDICDMWIHEGFTTYSEALFVETFYGKQAGKEYVIGQRKSIRNNEPMIGYANVNHEPTGDIYYKGASILLHIRTIMNNDSMFKEMLRAIQKEYGGNAGTTTSKEVTSFISKYSGINFSSYFKQYLYTNEVPTLRYKINKQKNKVKLSLKDCNDDLQLPINLNFGNGNQLVLLQAGKVLNLDLLDANTFLESMDAAYYILFENE